MRARSGHIVFPKKMKYKDLVPVYNELYMKFLRETEQLEEEDERNYMLVRLNLMDLEENRKPEGHNRNCRTKLIFPISESGIQMYVKSSSKSSEVIKVTESLSKLLSDRGINHTVEWDKLRYFEHR
ncbi:MAG: hypothetical protein JSW28_00085 [Thermoplasmata archaeon]|nr:MAG: hypothetical protein JSW28_00085 [Thermoplasmata archaeon]